MKSRFCLPNTVREPLLQAGRADCVFILDAIHGLDYDFGGVTTARELARILWACGVLVSPGLVRRALSDELFPSFLIPDRERGRPELFYRIPTVDFLVGVVAGGLVLSADELTLGDMKNIRSYRAGLHRTFLRRQKRCQYSREFLGRRLGVGDRATANYESGFADSIIVTPDYEHILLVGMSRDELSKVFDRVQVGRDIVEVVVDTGRYYGKFGAREGSIQTFPALFSIAWKLVQAGLMVKLKVRKCNVYEWSESF